MTTLTKSQLIGIIEAAQKELEILGELENTKKPIRGKKTVAYFCKNNKWKVEFMGKHIKWLMNEEEVKSFIALIES
jgi:hypothetical protein